MEQTKPVIGITASNEDGVLRISLACENAIVAAGGLPLVLPVHIKPEDAPALLQRCDGILFSGGVDVDPLRYGEEVLTGCQAIDEERDAAEEAYFDAARQMHMPIMGICRGHQVINVLCGGDLYQDIPEQLPGRSPMVQHRSRSRSDTLLHNIRTAPGSLLDKVTGGAAMRVTSTHHQAVRNVGTGLRAVGWASDGIVEALEGTGEDYLLTVQWHPENRVTREAHALALFRGLIEAARARMEKGQ